MNNYQPEIMLRTGAKIKIKVEFTDKQRVYRSPYYLCTQLWDKLEESIQVSNSIFEFKHNIWNFHLSEL